MLDGGRALCQSNAILIYLARQNKIFCGGNDSEWQSILEWLSWETNRIGFSVPNLRYSILWDKQPQDVLQYLRKRALTDLATLNEHLTQNEFLLSSGISIADLSCSAYLYWLKQVNIETADYLHIKRWLHSISNTRGWQHPDIAL